MTEPVTKYPGDNITSEWANALLTYLENLEPGTAGYTYMIYESDGVYYAKNGITNENDFEGPVLLAVVQSAVDAITEGIIVFRNLSVPAGLIEKDGVILISRNDGNYIERYTNPTVEVSTSNPDNKSMHSLIAYPTNDPTNVVGTAAWCVLTSEIFGKVGMSKFIAAGYFAAVSGASNCHLWGLNPLVNISADAGAGANAIGVEIDVNNWKTDGLCHGLTVEGTGTHDCSHAIWVMRAANKWQYGLTLQDILNVALDIQQDFVYAPMKWTPTTDLNVPYIYATNAAETLNTLEIKKGSININQLDAWTDAYLRLTHNNVDKVIISEDGQTFYGSPYLMWNPTADTDDVLINCMDVAKTKNLMEIRKGQIRINQLDAFANPFLRFYHNDIETFQVDQTGKIYFTTDTDLFRNAANELRTNDSFQANGYKSADGTTGLTQDVTVRNAAGDGTTTLSFKSGLLVSVT